MAEVKWIKIVTDVFNNKKIKQIDAMPDADAILVIWFKLLCLAGNVNESGLIILTKDIAYTDEMLATEFRKPLSTIRLALKIFETFGMVELVDSIYHISNWDRYQNIEGLEKIREQTRVRTIAYREKKKQLLLCDVTRDATVTHGNATELELEKELDIELDKEIDKSTDTKKKKPKKESVSLDTVILNFTDNEDLIKAINAYIEFRKTKGWDLTEYALELILKKIKPFPDEQRIKFIETSIEKSYRGVFVDNNLQPSYNKPVDTRNDINKDYSEGEDFIQFCARRHKEEDEQKAKEPK